MGLPIWNYPDEHKLDKTSKDIPKDRATVPSRSIIRRRPSLHGRRGNALSDFLRNTRGRDWESSLGSDTLPPVPDPVMPSRGRHSQSTARHSRGTATIARHHHPSQSSQSQQQSGAESHTSLRRARFASHQSAVPNVQVPSRNSRPRRTIQAATPPLHERLRPHSRTGAAFRPNMPTPPLDTSSLPTPSEILERNFVASPHPMTDTVRVAGLDGGLGDRRRSLSPDVDVWHVMHSTITPDETLPSAPTSFSTTTTTTTTAASTSLDDLHPEHGDATFEETMRGMGIEVSSSSDSSSTYSASDSDDQIMAGDDGHEQRNVDHERDLDNFTWDSDSEARSESEDQAQRRRIALQLYDDAMSTPEGRQQIDFLRRARTISNTHRSTYTGVPLTHEPLTILRDSHDMPTPRSHSGDQESASGSGVPPPEPEQFGTDVHTRAQEATSRTRAFFAQPLAQDTLDPEHGRVNSETLREQRRQGGTAHPHDAYPPWRSPQGSGPRASARRRVVAS